QQRPHDADGGPPIGMPITDVVDPVVGGRLHRIDSDRLAHPVEQLVEILRRRDRRIEVVVADDALEVLAAEQRFTHVAELRPDIGPDDAAGKVRLQRRGRIDVDDGVRLVDVRLPSHQRPAGKTNYPRDGGTDPAEAPSATNLDEYVGDELLHSRWCSASENG